MIARLAVIALLVAWAPAAQASELLVVGRSDTLDGPRTVRAHKQRLTVSGRRCKIGARTPLAALLDSGLKVAVRDYGACGRRAASAAGLYVRGVGGERERGRDGWVYKVGNRAPSVGAADLGARTRGRVSWFWCRMGASGCQRTLVARPEQDSVAPGATLRVRVTAYDNDGDGIPAAGATVTFGDATAVAGSDGVATVPSPAEAGTLDVVATQAKRVRSFAEPVEVG